MAWHRLGLRFRPPCSEYRRYDGIIDRVEPDIFVEHWQHRLALVALQRLAHDLRGARGAGRLTASGPSDTRVRRCARRP